MSGSEQDEEPGEIPDAVADAMGLENARRLHMKRLALAEFDMDADAAAVEERIAEMMDELAEQHDRPEAPEP